MIMVKPAMAYLDVVRAARRRLAGSRCGVSGFG